MNKLLFFCFASAVLLFSIIVINISPIIKGLLYSGGIDYTHSCKYYSDQYDYNEKHNKNNDALLDFDKKNVNRCNRIHAMTGLEYTSLNVNLFIGFVCALLGLLVYLNIVEDRGKIAGLIGLGGGVVGFVLTFVYVIYSGLIFDDRAEYPSSLPPPSDKDFKIDSDGAFLKWDDSRGSYTCIFYDKDNRDSIYLRYSDYGNKFLSYNKDSHEDFNDEEKYKTINSNSDNRCNSYESTYFQTSNWIDWDKCKDIDEKKGSYNIPKYSNCDKIFHFDRSEDSNKNKIIFDKWLTSLIFSCFICLFNIGLAIFGFLLFKGSHNTI